MNNIINNQEMTMPLLSFIYSIILLVVNSIVILRSNKEGSSIEMLKWKKETIDLIQEYFSNSFEKDKMKENGKLYHKIFTNILLLFNDEILNKFEQYRVIAEKLCVGLEEKEIGINNEEYYKSYRDLLYSIREYNKMPKY